MRWGVWVSGICGFCVCVGFWFGFEVWVLGGMVVFAWCAYGFGVWFCCGVIGCCEFRFGLGYLGVCVDWFGLCC